MSLNITPAGLINSYTTEKMFEDPKNPKTSKILDKDLILKEFLFIEEFGILPNKSLLKKWRGKELEIINNLDYNIINEVIRVKKYYDFFGSIEILTKELQSYKANNQVLKKSQYILNQNVLYDSYTNFLKYMEDETYFDFVKDSFFRLLKIKTFNFLNFIILCIMMFINVYSKGKIRDNKYIAAYIKSSYLGSYLADERNKNEYLQEIDQISEDLVARFNDDE